MIYAISYMRVVGLIITQKKGVEYEIFIENVSLLAGPPAVISIRHVLLSKRYYKNNNHRYGGKKGVGGGGTPVDSDERGGDRTIQ